MTPRLSSVLGLPLALPTKVPLKSTMQRRILSRDGSPAPTSDMAHSPQLLSKSRGGAPSASNLLSPPAAPPRDTMHIKRKLFHCVAGVLFVVGLEFGVSQWSETVRVLWALSLMAVLLVVDTARTAGRAGLIGRAVAPLLRDYEAEGGQRSGGFWSIWGDCLAVLLFPLPVAQVAILAGAIGDPLASAVGIATGWRAVGRGGANPKSVFGAVVGAAGGAALVYCFGAVCHPSDDFVGVALVAGAVSAATELAVPLALAVDDNFIMPIFAAAAVARVFPGFA